MRVLLLAHAFPPYNASGAVRAAKLADHLLARGHDVRVLTGRPQPYPETLATTFPIARVTATSWRRIEAPLDHLRARLGHRLARAGPAPAATGSAGPVRPSLAARGVVAYRSLVSIPDPQAGWIRPAVAAGRAVCANWRPELIYSTALPFSSHVAAGRLAHATGAPWVAEYRDLFSGNPYADLWPARRRLDAVLERRVLRSAAAVVSVSEPLTAYLTDLHGKPGATIMNGYDPADLAAAPDMADAFDPARLAIVYTGIIYPGRRDPAVLFEALRRLGDRRRRCLVRFHGPGLDAVAAAARAAGVADVVETAAPVPYAASLGLQKAADVLLLLLWDSPLEQGVLTGKLFEYAGAGRPILSLGCLDGAAAGLIRDRGLGLATTEPDQVAAWLMARADAKAAGRDAAADLAPDRASGLTRRAQFEALEDFLTAQGLLTRPAPQATGAAVGSRAG